MKEVPTDNKFIGNVCLSYRHDFGLMDDESKYNLIFECKEWIRAINNNLNIKLKESDPNIVDIASMMSGDIVRLEAMIDRDKYWKEKIEKQIESLETKYSVDSDWDSEIYQLKLLLK